MSPYIDQHLSNLWSSIDDKVKQHWGWVEKSVAYKKACSWWLLSVRCFTGSGYFSA